MTIDEDGGMLFFVGGVVLCVLGFDAEEKYWMRVGSLVLYLRAIV